MDKENKEKGTVGLGIITASESELNSLFKETLDGIRDDIKESQENVGMYFDAIVNETGGKELYGTLYNDSLKIKGMARDRQLKFLNMFKDRVSNKEKLKLVTEAAKGEAGGYGFSHADINKMIEESERLNSIKPVIGSEDDDDDIDID